MSILIVDTDVYSAVAYTLKQIMYSNGDYTGQLYFHFGLQYPQLWEKTDQVINDFVKKLYVENVNAFNNAYNYQVPIEKLPEKYINLDKLTLIKQLNAIHYQIDSSKKKIVKILKNILNDFREIYISHLPEYNSIKWGNL